MWYLWIIENQHPPLRVTKRKGEALIGLPYFYVMLLIIDSGYFYAGAVYSYTEDNRLICTRAAPIIKWLIGKEYEPLRAYFDRKGWKVHWSIS